MRTCAIVRLSGILLCGMLSALAGCGKLNAENVPVVGPQANMTIKMAASTFVGYTAITLFQGGTLTFDDLPSSGVTHFLVTGQNGMYTEEDGAPSELNTPDGYTVLVGQSPSFTFASTGTFSISCLIHPAMNLQVTVVSSS